MSRPPIRDEFTELDVSRQRKWQLRKRKRGLCMTCGDKAIAQGYCADHLAKHAIADRQRYRIANNVSGVGGWKYPEKAEVR